MRRHLGGPVITEIGPLRILEETLRCAVERVGIAEAAAAHPRAARNEHVLEDAEPQDALHPELGKEEVATQVPRRLREFVAGEAPTRLEHAHALAGLAETQRADAATEARPDDQPVEVVHAAVDAPWPAVRPALSGATSDS